MQVDVQNFQPLAIHLSKNGKTPRCLEHIACHVSKLRLGAVTLVGHTTKMWYRNTILSDFRVEPELNAKHQCLSLKKIRVAAIHFVGELQTRLVA